LFSEVMHYMCFVAFSETILTKSGTRQNSFSVKLGKQVSLTVSVVSHSLSYSYCFESSNYVDLVTAVITDRSNIPLASLYWWQVLRPGRMTSITI